MTNIVNHGEMLLIKKEGFENISAFKLEIE